MGKGGTFMGTYIKTFVEVSSHDRWQVMGCVAVDKRQTSSPYPGRIIVNPGYEVGSKGGGGVKGKIAVVILCVLFLGIGMFMGYSRLNVASRKGGDF